MFSSNGTTNMQIFMGNVGKDPFVSQGNNPGGRLMAAFPLALDASYKDRSGNKVKRTYWIDVKGFGKTAEFIRDFIRAGQKVFVLSHVETRKVQGQGGGRDQYVTDFVIDEITFAGASPEQDARAQQGGQYRQHGAAPGSNPRQNFQPPAHAPHGQGHPGYPPANVPQAPGHHYPPPQGNNGYPPPGANGNGRDYCDQAPPPNHYGGYTHN